MQFVMQIMFLNKKGCKYTDDCHMTCSVLLTKWLERGRNDKYTLDPQNVISKDDDSGQLPIPSGRFRQQKSMAKKS